MAHMALKPIHWCLGNLGQPCVHFILAYFCSLNFQLNTNKNVVVVVLLSLVQKWTSGHPTNVDIFNLCQSILWRYILVTGLLTPSTHHQKETNYTLENALQNVRKVTRLVWWFLLWYYSTREFKSYDCRSSFLSVQYLYFPNKLTLSVLFR